MSASRDQRRHLYEQLVGSDVANGRYKITDLLGFGGMGAVYAALQRNMDRSVALKLIPTHDPTIVARFEREALTISKLQHPNTVTVFDYGKGDDGFLFLAMELLDGRTLSEAIKEGPLTAQTAVHITSQICRSLAEAHRSGIVHRDIKPDNIILIQVDQDRDFVKVLDFGIAKAVMGEDDVQLTGDGRIIGTPRYMSPEQILAEPLDHRSDIYSLGCILYEMLCGAPPFEQSSTTALMISHTQDPPPTFSQRLDPSKYSMMPPALEQVVRKALSKSPNDRHQTTDELRDELEAAIEGRLAPTPIIDADSTAAAIPSSMAQHPPSTGSRPVPVHITQSSELAKPPSGTNPLVYAIILLVLVIGGLVAYATLTGGEQPRDQQPTNPDPFGATSGAVVGVDTTESAPEKDERPGWASVSISGSPAGATVTAGGEKLGSTPMVKPFKKDRETVKLVISKKGYQPLQFEVLLEGEDAKKVDYKLNPLEKKEVAPKPRIVRKKKEPKKATPEKPEETEQPEKKEEEKPTSSGIELIDDSSDVKVPRLLD